MERGNLNPCGAQVIGESIAQRKAAADRAAARYQSRKDQSAENIGDNAVIPVNRLLVVLLTDVCRFTFLADEAGGLFDLALARLVTCSDADVVVMRNQAPAGIGIARRKCTRLGDFGLDDH